MYVLLCLPEHVTNKAYIYTFNCVSSFFFLKILAYVRRSSWGSVAPDVWSKWCTYWRAVTDVDRSFPVPLLSSTHRTLCRSCGALQLYWQSCENSSEDRCKGVNKHPLGGLTNQIEGFHQIQCALCIEFSSRSVIFPFTISFWYYKRIVHSFANA